MFTHRSPTTLELVALAIAMLGAIAALIVSIGGMKTIYYYLRGDTRDPEAAPACDDDLDYSEDTRLYDLGREALDDARPGDALKLLQRSWDLFQHAGTAHQIAVALQALNRPEESLQWHTSAYELNAKNSKFAVAYAESLYTQGRTPEATKVLKRTLKHNRDYGPAKRLLETITAQT